MGVRRSDYILVGANIIGSIGEMSDDFYEGNEDYLWRNNHLIGKMAYLDDGYSGKYFIVGIPLQMDISGYDGLDLMEIDLDSVVLKHYSDMVKSHVQEHFNIQCEPKLIVLTHYT